MNRIDIYELYQLVIATLNTQQGGHLRPNENFIRWVNAIQIELFNSLRKDWGKNQKTTDALIPFLRTFNIRIDVSKRALTYDVFNYPPDYFSYSSARILMRESDNVVIAKEDCPIWDSRDEKITEWKDADELQLEAEKAKGKIREISIENLDNQRWGGRMKHRFLKPKVNNPAITQFDGGFKMAPSDIDMIVLDYFRAPRMAQFSYTMGSGDTIVYDQAGSVQLEWPSTQTEYFVAALKKRYGTYTGQDNMYSQGEAERREA